MADILFVDKIYKRFGRTVTAKGITLRIKQGEFFTFLGPSGSGKSTLLRMIAGLETPDSGEIYIGGRAVGSVPPWKRDLGMVFQHYAVFPHMSVMDNVCYGLRMRGVARRDAEERGQRMLELVGLGSRGNAVVTRMSGGEQQRVALARALAPEPMILLLDEPLSALDEKIRRQMQKELKGIQKKLGTTFVYVTHDQEEALTMSDRVGVFNNGLCEQVDEPHTLHRVPRTRFVADFFRGSNVVSASVEGVDEERGLIQLSIGAAKAAIKAKRRLTIQQAVDVALRAENLRLGRSAKGATVHWTGIIVAASYRGAMTDYEVEVERVGRVVATTMSREQHDVGSSVEIGIDAEHVVILDD